MIQSDLGQNFSQVQFNHLSLLHIPLPRSKPINMVYHFFNQARDVPVLDTLAQSVNNLYDDSAYDDNQLGRGNDDNDMASFLNDDL